MRPRVVSLVLVEDLVVFRYLADIDLLFPDSCLILSHGPPMPLDAEARNCYCSRASQSTVPLEWN